MNLWTALFAAGVGYFIGAISFARLVGRIVARGEDLSTTSVDIGGSDKQVTFVGVSATSISMRKGPAVGCLTGFLDMLKAFIPVYLFKTLYPEGDYFLITAAASVAGHNYPIYYRFKGGMGLSPLIGSLVVIDWVSIPVTIIASSIFGFVFVRDLLFAYGGMTLLLIPWLWFRFGELSYVLYAIFIAVLFWTAITPTMKGYLALKRAGEFDKASILETGYSADFLQSLRDRKILKSASVSEKDPDDSA